MASQAAGAKKRPVNLWLIAVLGVLIVIGISFAISNKNQAADPTITAAPPNVAPPGHPIVTLRKSPEAMALQMREAGMTGPTGASGQPTAKQ